MNSWRKNLYSIWIAQFIAMVGMSMVIPFLPFYVRELGITDHKEVEMWSALTFAGPFIMAFIMTPIWGSLSDKYGKKAMVLRAIFGLALSQLLIGLSANVFQLLVFRMFQGFVSGFIAASLALVSATTPKEKSGYAIGVLQTSISAGTIIGPVLGGLLSDVTTYSMVFMITASICLISGVLVMFIVKEPPVEKKEKNFTVAENYRYVFNNKKILIAMLSVTVVQISVFMAQPIFALFVESFEVNTEYLATVAGTLFGVTGVFTVISSPWWGKRNDTSGFRINLLIAMLGAAIAFILHSFIYNIILLYPVRAFLGFCIGGIVPVFYSYIAKNTSEDRKGGIMGIASSFTLLGNLFGPLICIMLVYNFSNRYVFLFSGIVMLINTFIVFNNMKEGPAKRINPDYYDGEDRISKSTKVKLSFKKRNLFGRRSFNQAH